MTNRYSIFLNARQVGRVFITENDPRFLNHKVATLISIEKTGALKLGNAEVNMQNHINDIFPAKATDETIIIDLTRRIHPTGVITFNLAPELEEF